MMEEMTSELSTNRWVVRPDRDLEDLIPDFMNNRKKDMEDLKDAIARDDFIFIQRLGHTLKGISRPYGFDHLETLSKNLEVAAENKNRTEVRRIENEIKSYLENIKIVFE